EPDAVEVDRIRRGRDGEGAGGDGLEGCGQPPRYGGKEQGGNIGLDPGERTAARMGRLGAVAAEHRLDDGKDRVPIGAGKELRLQTRGIEDGNRADAAGGPQNITDRA